MRHGRADLVVVGAGIIGLAVARAFAEEEPEARISVSTRRRPSRGTRRGGTPA